MTKSIVAIVVILVIANPVPSSAQKKLTSWSLEMETWMTKSELDKKVTLASQKLPHAQNKTFRSLDEYLAHLKKLGAQDRPFYESVGPNEFKLNTGRGGHLRPPQYFTRQQLLKKFGFTR